jgi:Radical SAM superfamily
MPRDSTQTTDLLTMTQSTEAACLLQTGSMYPARLGLRGGSGEDVFFGIKSGGFSLYFGDEPIVHFDFEGRWQRAFIEGIHYLKGLDASVRAIGREREGAGLVLRRRVLGPDEIGEIDETIRLAALDLIDGISASRLDAISPPPPVRMIGLGELTGHLERVAEWDAAAWQAHRNRYRVTYGPWPFLPPDCPNPVVLQATHGHDFGLGATSEPLVRSKHEFEEHALAVAKLLGRRTSQCRDIFLGDADVLRQPTGLVLDYLQTIGSCFSLMFDPFRIGTSGSLEPETSKVSVVHAFLDDFRPPLPEIGGWRSLKAARLGRVTVGIESGDPAIRRILGKSWKNEELRETVNDLKEAGIGVGLVALVGMGGRAASDLEASAQLIGSLDFAEGDLISIVDSRSLGITSFASEPLSDEETAEQQGSLKKRLNSGRSSKGPRVVLYNPDKQWA